jgi:hypothetical protein
LFGNIKKENRFEIKPATSQERIQKNKKFDLSMQLMLANVKVMKKVVAQFCSSLDRIFLYGPAVFILI